MFEAWISSGGTEPFVCLGEVKAIKLTLSDGKELYSGEPEAVFDLRTTLRLTKLNFEK